jgi:hypothetical protein
MKPKTGYIYWLEDYTAPKVFNGLYFECLVTDQKIWGGQKIKKDSGIYIANWTHEIYKPERFGLPIKSSTNDKAQVEGR